MSCLPVRVGVLTHITLCQFEFSKSGRKITLLLAYIGTSQFTCISFRNAAKLKIGNYRTQVNLGSDSWVWLSVRP